MFGVNVDEPQKRQKPPVETPAGGTAIPVNRPPNLRRFLQQSAKVKFIAGVALVFTVGVSWRVFHCNKRKKTYLNFYDFYDERADFERMRQAGVFQSCKPDGSISSPE